MAPDEGHIKISGAVKDRPRNNTIYHTEDRGADYLTKDLVSQPAAQKRAALSCWAFGVEVCLCT